MPYVGEFVHYVAHGTPRREDGSQAYPSACRAAVVTAVGEATTFRRGDLVLDAAVLDLCVFNPAGLFFNQGVSHDPAGGPGTWHTHFGGAATYATPCPAPSSVSVPLGDLDLAAVEDVHPDLSRMANSIGYALRTRGVQLTAADAVAAARRVVEQSPPDIPDSRR